MTIQSQHQQFVADLITCDPASERARELRAMIRRLELIAPDLEHERVASMQAQLRLKFSVPPTLIEFSYDPAGRQAPARRQP